MVRVLDMPLYSRLSVSLLALGEKSTLRCASGSYFSGKQNTSTFLFIIKINSQKATSFE